MSGSIGLGEEGNTNLSSLGVSRKKRIAASRYWCFTLNNYEESDCGSIGSIFSSLEADYLFSKEIGASGTRHLQGWVGFKTKCRPTECIKKHKTIHWEKARGNKHQAIGYCLKGNGEVFSNFDYSEYKPRVIKNRMEGLTFKDWQLEILEMVKHDPDDRKIYWYVDVAGGCGKTTFCHYLSGINPNAWCFGGSVKDCMAGIVLAQKQGKNVDICMFDFPRSLDPQYLSYQAIESVKNGYFYSGKYESGMYRDNVKHVFVFANVYPDENQLSKDRWVIKEIN